MKKNVIFFTWENELFLKRDIDKWIKVFTEKYGNFNIFKYNTDNISDDVLSNIFSMSFFNEKKLIIINWLPSNTTIKDDKIVKLEEKLANSLEEVPEDVFLIFAESAPDKRKNLYKKLLKTVTVKSYENISPYELKNYIKNNYNIENRAADKLFDYCLWDLASIQKYLDKLELFKWEELITEKDVSENVREDSVWNIFALLDLIVAGRKKEVIKIIKTILEKEESMIFLASMITNLRNIVYCHKLIDSGYNKQDIIAELWIKDYYIKLASNSVRNKDEIFELYSLIVDIDNRIKKWDLVPDSSDEAIELSLMKILK